VKVIAILGSPRPKGNSATIARRFCETAEGLGADITSFLLNELTYKGCQGCMACKGASQKCVQKDDLAPVLDAIYTADIVVVATPVYAGEVSGQLKCFIDRMFSYLVPEFDTAPVKTRLQPGKKLVFIITQADPDQTHYSDIFPRYQMVLEWLGFEEIVLIRGCGLMTEGDAAKRDDLLQLADDTARRMMA